MTKISYIYEKDINKYEGLSTVKELSSVEDVATIVETFEDVKNSVGFERIKYVVEDDEKYYYFVISEKVEEFDIFEFINNTLVIDVKVSFINVKSLFPRRASRGIYEADYSIDDVCTSEQDVDQDSPTEYLDDTGRMDKNILMVLRDKKKGLYVDIPEKGLTIGRSSNKVDYVIKDNTNIGRVHCKLYYGVDGYLMVHDCDSLNGTFVNNRRVYSNKDVTIHGGDLLSLANEDFEIQEK